MKKLNIQINRKTKEKEKNNYVFNRVLYLFYTKPEISNRTNGKLVNISYTHPKDFLNDNLKRIDKYIKYVDEVWFVGLDENYISWLKENNINIRYDENAEHRLEYAKTLTKEQVEKTWKNFGFYKYVDVMYLPFSIVNSDNFCSNNQFMLIGETKEKVETIMKNTLEIDDDKFILSKYIVFTHMANEYEKDFRDIFNCYFFKNINVVFGKLENQYMDKKVNIHTFAMCVGILSTFENCIYSEEYFRENTLLDEVECYIKEFPIKDIINLVTKDFEEQNKIAYEKLGKEYDGKISVNEILPTLIYADEINSIMYIFFKILSKKVKLNYV